MAARLGSPSPILWTAGGATTAYPGRVTAPNAQVNVCFHGVGLPRRELEPGEEGYWIGTAEFVRILDLLAGRDEVRLSFDDGNWSDLEHALPALRERDLTATFFVIAGRLGKPGSLDDDAVRHLHDQGMTIGSHGMDHRSWRGVAGDTMLRELVEARERISEVTGRPVTEAAFPRGQYDRLALRHLRRLGYDAVHTSDRRRARTGAWLQPRYSVRATDTAESILGGVVAPPSLARRAERAVTCSVKRLR